ncbi:GMC family oxidoreductase [Fulvivirgaceae bacterium BMA12]|uniref:GMC family oxidoreductase n=1 Tax=Agaribacillus aureus TaxID=3051825 RepID=A0ABT8LC16_9BACT|nr:GMC family oxidoreductase [Fulvivirgaceae bacterium BMA12]
MNLNNKAKKQNTYDAIVVGSGISGGWAAKELSEKGLKTLVLERGRNIQHVKDYPTMHLNPWELPNADHPSEEDIRQQHKQNRTGYTVRPSSKHWFVNDLENPYTEVKRFDWMRGYHVGGRSIMWGRHSYRWSDLDFEANAKDGYGVDWPIRYKDIAPWYDYVEEFAGIQGQAEGLPQLPDGKFLPAMKLNCLETHAREKVLESFPDRLITIGRTANLSVPHKGRGKCMNRNRCIRGCPYGGYFSSNASTLPAAAASGNMTLRPNSIVNSIIYDKESGKASGVRVIDAESNETVEFYARIIFLNASALGSTFILLNSKSDRFPNGLGNDSGELGHNLMDHHFRIGARGEYDGFADKYYSGRRPTGFYIPRFRNVKEQRTDYLRGFGYQGRASREDWKRGIKEMSFGAEFKDEIVAPGKWNMGMTAFGEHLPYHENHVKLNEEVRDKWGQPTLTIDCEFKENELTMRKDMAASAVEILEAAGLKNITTFDSIGGPGLGIHEMGTARMGRDPKTSVLNKFNQIHAVPNVFVTDGACMTSAACQNPSLTYMALTARACDHAVKEINRSNL